MEAEREQNHVPTTLGASVTDGTAMPLLVDPATDRLLVVIYPSADEVPVTGEYTNKAKRDQNHVPVGLAVTDDSNEDVKSLITPADATAQYLYVDLLIEP